MADPNYEYQIAGEWLRLKRVTGQVSIPMTASIDYPHLELHKGHAFVYTGGSILASGGSVNISILPPTVGENMHLTMALNTSGAANYSLYENATVEGGATLTAFNRNRVDGSASLAALRMNPTVSAFGTALMTVQVGAGQRGGGQGRETNEWILNRGYTYVLNVVSEANTNDIYWELDWYEHLND